MRIIDPSMEPYDDCICIKKKDDSREAFDEALVEAMVVILSKEILFK